MKTLILLCCFMLTACCWEHQIAIHPGDADITQDSVCISSSRGKNLSSYGVEGRDFSKYHTEWKSIVQKELSAQTPYCFKLNLESYMMYTLHYKVDDVVYDVDFVTDGSPVVFKRAE